MTTAILTRPTAAVRPVSFGRLLASEWIKLRTVRATVWTLSVTVVVMVGLAALSGWSSTLLAGGDVEVDTMFLGSNPASIATSGVFFAQLVVLVLGALTITGEYGTGMIRSTFAAAPTRIPALLGKATVLFATVFAASSLAVALSWLVSLPFLGQLGQSVDLTSAETWRILGSAPLYLATMSVLALAVGVLVRHSAAAIAIVIGLVLVIESVISAIPLRFFELIGPFLPATAGGRLLMDETTLDFMGTMGGTQLGPWQGYGVLVAWVAVLLTAALALARSRDA